jgi:putative GTP pyrophosphokinase
MTDTSLAEQYSNLHDQRLTVIAIALQSYLSGILSGQKRIDRIAARAKAPSSFLAKAMKTEGGLPKYTNPLFQIHDQIAARVVTFYLADVERVQRVIEEYFGSIESKRMEPESSSEFGYEGHHYVLFLPDEAFPRPLNPKDGPTFFELQIKTLFQHAWSEGAHDLIYKPSVVLTREQRRRAAFTAAQAWGADLIFDELSAQLLSGGTSH